MTPAWLIVALLVMVVLIEWARPRRSPANRLMRNLNRLIERDLRHSPSPFTPQSRVMMIAMDHNNRNGVTRFAVECSPDPLYERYHREEATPDE